MPERLTRHESKAQTRAQLIEAAARVFSRKGYRTATVDDIAREAGFTKGAFYSNFATKDDVFMELVADRSRSWTIAAANAYTGDAPITERFLRGGEVLTRMVEEEADWMLLSNELWANSVRDPRRRQRLAEAYEECRLVIARVIADVEAEYKATMPLPTDQVAALTVALTDGFVLQRLIDPERVPAHLLADGMNLLFSSLLAPSTLAKRD